MCASTITIKLENNTIGSNATLYQTQVTHNGSPKHKNTRHRITQPARSKISATTEHPIAPSSPRDDSTLNLPTTYVVMVTEDIPFFIPVLIVPEHP